MSDKKISFINFNKTIQTQLKKIQQQKNNNNKEVLFKNEIINGESNDKEPSLNTTLALGEEGGEVVTDAIGESGETSQALGEEGGGMTPNEPTLLSPKDSGLPEDAIKAVFGELSGEAMLTNAKFDDQGRITSFSDNLMHAEGIPTYEVSYGENGSMKIFKSQFSERTGQVEQNVVYRYDSNDFTETTLALGEEGGDSTVTSQALGEEGGEVVTDAIGESGETSQALGEEGGEVVTEAINEGGISPVIDDNMYTTMSVNESGVNPVIDDSNITKYDASGKEVKYNTETENIPKTWVKSENIKNINTNHASTLYERIKNLLAKLMKS